MISFIQTMYYFSGNILKERGKIMKSNFFTTKFLVFFALMILFTSAAFGQTKNEEWFVSDKLADCNGGSMQKCLVVREVNSNNWTYFSGTIQDFKFRENYTQKIRVRIKPRKNVPQDASAFEYKLVKTLNRSKTNGNTHAEAMRQLQNQKPLSLGGKWTITEIEDMKVENGKATIEFNEKEKSFGAKICNGMGGNYELDISKIKFSKTLGTMMYCGEPLQPIEDRFKIALEKITRGERNGDNLIFFAGNRAVMKMKIERNSSSNKMLENTKWALTEISGEKISVKGENPYLQFDKESAGFAGFAGCNRFFGKYEAIGSQLKLSGIGMTKRACVDAEIGKTEMQMVQALGKINRFEIKENSLNLYEGNKILLRFMALER